MRHYVLWLIFVQLCGSDYSDYSDYHPKNIPFENTLSLRSDNPSPEYNEIMRNLCDNWQSPISYLKKRGYMPSGTDKENNADINHNENDKKITGDNYFFFPQNEEQSLKDNLLLMEEEEEERQEPDVTNPDTDPPPLELEKNDTSGIINKVRDKFFSIFAHKGHEEDNAKVAKSRLLDWNYDIYDPDFLENSNDYEISDKRIFVRSAGEKQTIDNPAADKPCVEPANNKTANDQSSNAKSTTEKPAKNNPFNEEIFTNLTATEIQYVKSFINCYKQSKGYLLQQNDSTTTPKPSTNTTTTKPKVDSKSNEEAKPSEVKPSEKNETKLTEAKSESKTNATIPSTTNPSEMKPTPTNTEDKNTTCFPIDSIKQFTFNTSTQQALPTPTPSTTKENIAKTTSKTKVNGSKEFPDDFTVDLDINQKNGTGEEANITESYVCVPSALSSSKLLLCKNKDKYATKSKFLAHLHHMVDEVGKPPHKSIDLRKVQDVIDKFKNPSLVIMADSKTTQCAPLRLNDMSFDLEWNKIETSPEKDRNKLGIIDYPRINQPQGQSLAAKFLQDVYSYPNNKEEYLNTPYGDNFLDSQQTLPDNLEVKLKASTKREAVLPNSASHGHKLSKLLASLPDSEDDDDYYADEDASKRRVKARMKNRKKSKSKFKGGATNNKVLSNGDDVMSMDELKNGNDFNSFQELKDIQFRVNNDDEEAISRFISNLNSPPEVFSFDVDKYLRSAQLDMEPQAPEFEIQSVEPRTYYEFMETSAVEKERLPLIDAPAEEEPTNDNRRRKSGGKRDLLRQYIKGVSTALSQTHPELNAAYTKNDEDKRQRSPNEDTEINFRTNSLIDGFSSNLDAMNYIKSNERDDFLDNFYLLNDGSSQIYDLAIQDPDIIPSDKYSPQSLEIDLELDKKFRDLGIGAYSGADKSEQNSASVVDIRNVNDAAKVNQQIERRDFELEND